MKSLPATDSVWMREFEPALMRELEDLMKIVPHCPHCGSIALQGINGLAMCDDCPWTGSDHDAYSPYLPDAGVRGFIVALLTKWI